MQKFVFSLLNLVSHNLKNLSPQAAASSPRATCERRYSLPPLPSITQPVCRNSNTNPQNQRGSAQNSAEICSENNITTGPVNKSIYCQNSFSPHFRIKTFSLYINSNRVKNSRVTNFHLLRCHAHRPRSFIAFTTFYRCATSKNMT